MSESTVPGPLADTSHRPFVEMRQIRKSFGGSTVLQDVDLDVRRGEVHALVGGNGAGKSTLMKILQGVYRMDAGEILISGERADIRSAHDARAAGVGMVFQEFSLVPSLTVAQNIFLTREARGRFGLIDERTSARKAREIFAYIGVEINVNALVEDLSTAYRQLTEIAKALSQSAQVLILDEPTSSLAQHEVESLFEIIGRLKAQNLAIIYISHRMDEIYRIADRISVLRDGRRLFTKTMASVTPNQIVEGIAGKAVDGSLVYEEREMSIGGQVLLEAVDLRSGPRVNGVSFQLRAGEVLGIAGLMGSGRTELARCLFGVDRLDAGEVRMHAKVLKISNPQAAKKAGIALIPEDRREQGLVLDHSVSQNLLLPVLGSLRRGWLLNVSAGKRLVSSLVERLAIKTGSVDTPVRLLSGGNQQKVVIAKWLATEPEVLIMDEPTTGVDVGTKAEIVMIIRGLADAGRGVIIISSEFPELLAVSDRVLVLRDGMVRAELKRAAITSEESLQLAVQGVEP
jgi:ribose transport system ATP-binding protein